MALTKKQLVDALLQGAIDAYRAGRLAEAIDHLARGSGAFPRAAKVWGYLGFLYSEARNHVNAIQAFRKAVTLSPHSEQASLGLFHSLWRAGKTDAAFDEMRRFVKHNDSPRYRELLRDMLTDPPARRSARRQPLVVA